MDAYHRVSLLNLVVHGVHFETKKNGVAPKLVRKIEQEEAKRL